MLNGTKGTESNIYVIEFFLFMVLLDEMNKTHTPTTLSFSQRLFFLFSFVVVAFVCCKK